MPAASAPAVPPPPGTFEILARDEATGARAGRLWTAHGAVETPVFMPVGTQASVKSLAPWELEAMDCRIVLANTYHLALRPGAEAVSAMGGLHAFESWDRAILTDSGGFQVFSLSDLRKISDEGVRFRSHLDGTELFMGPRESMNVQRLLSSDIAMAFDECPPCPCEKSVAEKAVARTIAWAEICAGEPRAEGQLRFGIVQGGVYPDLRRACAEAVCAMEGFEGFAIGGVSVGEPEELILPGVEMTAPFMPETRPRYLMGVGQFWQMSESVARGVDMFDCVMPTRLSRHGSVFTREGRYNLKNAANRLSDRPLEEGCACPACQRFTRAYVRHLLQAKEILGVRLVTAHNIHRYLETMKEMRSSILEGTFGAFRARIASTYGPEAKTNLLR